MLRRSTRGRRPFEDTIGDGDGRNLLAQQYQTGQGCKAHHQSCKSWSQLPRQKMMARLFSRSPFDSKDYFLKLTLL